MKALHGFGTVFVHAKNDTQNVGGLRRPPWKNYAVTFYPIYPKHNIPYGTSKSYAFTGSTYMYTNPEKRNLATIHIQRSTVAPRLSILEIKTTSLPSAMNLSSKPESLSDW